MFEKREWTTLTCDLNHAYIKKNFKKEREEEEEKDKKILHKKLQFSIAKRQKE